MLDRAEVPGVDRAARRPAPPSSSPTSRRPICSTGSTTWWCRPASPPHHPLVVGRRRGRARRLLRARAGLAAARAGRAALARGHRHQRQDHDHHHARRDPARRPGCAPPRWATSASRWSSPATGAGYDVLAVELSSFQLHWSSTLAPQAGALLNLADDHLEWHGDFAAYAGAKTAVWRGRAPVRHGGRQPRRPAGGRATLAGVAGRTVGFTLAGTGSRASSGVVDGMLVDRVDDGAGRSTGRRAIRPAGRAQRRQRARRRRAGPVVRRAGRRGPRRAGRLRARAAPQRVVATVDGVAYVDDSKATNPHAALASLHRVPAHGLGRRRPAQGRRHRRPGRRASPTGWPGRCCSGVDRAEVARRAGATRAGGPGGRRARTDDGAMAEVVRAAAGAGRGRATPCCWRRPPRRWTCSPATRTGATRSPPPSAGCPETSERPTTGRSAKATGHGRRASEPLAPLPARGRPAGRAARPARPAAGLVLPAAGQRRPAADDRPGDGLLARPASSTTRQRQRVHARSPSRPSAAAVGLLAFWVCQRLPARTYRALAGSGSSPASC